jgi:hypothetical protein
MKMLVGALILLAIVAGPACAAGSGEAAEAQEAADQEAIAALWVEYGQSRMDCDAARRLAIHDMDALKMPQDRPMFRIRDIAEGLQASWAKQDKTSNATTVGGEPSTPPVDSAGVLVSWHERN